MTDIVAPKKPVYPEGFPFQVPDVRETHILTVRYMENSGWLEIDPFLDEVKASDYDAIIVPGGAWNPDNLRMEKDAHKLFQDASNSSGCALPSNAIGSFF